MVSTRMRLAAGVCVLAAGHLIGGAGAGVAVADAGSAGSAEHGDDGIKASGQQQPATGRTRTMRPKKEPGGIDSKDKRKDSGLVAAVTNAGAPVPNVMAPVPKLVAAASDVIVSTERTASRGRNTVSGAPDVASTAVQSWTGTPTLSQRVKRFRDRAVPVSTEGTRGRVTGLRDIGEATSASEHSTTARIPDAQPLMSAAPGALGLSVPDTLTQYFPAPRSVAGGADTGARQQDVSATGFNGESGNATSRLTSTAVPARAGVTDHGVADAARQSVTTIAPAAPTAVAALDAADLATTNQTFAPGEKISAPAQMTSGMVSTLVARALTVFAENGPTTPPGRLPTPLTLIAFARREFGGALLGHSPNVDSLVGPVATSLAVGDAAGLAGASAQAAKPALDAAADEATFTGEPSLVTQGFVAGLRLINPVLRLAGIELNGSSATIPFITDGIPPFFLTHGLDAKSEEYAGWTTWTLTPAEPSGNVVVAIHGGSFISRASILHWWMYADMARDTGATVIVPLYPLANEEGTGGTAATVVPTMADFISTQVADPQRGGAEHVSVLGDSAGGAIALAATQELVRRCNADPDCDPAEALPGRVVLIAPVLDAGLSNPNAELVDDPLLDPEASRRNGQLWAGNLDIKDPVVSPLYGSLEGLPPTTVYAGSLDLRAPDVLVLQQLVAATPGADFTFELRKGQIHDWIIFAFLPDARAERPGLYSHLGLTTNA